MRAWLTNLLLLVSIAAVSLTGWAAWRVGVLARSISIPDLTATVGKLNQALDTVNHPCAPGPCGTLANVDKLTIKVGDLAVTSQRQEAQVGVLVAATASNLNTVGDSVKQVAGSLQKTADASTDSLKAATADLQTAQPSIAAFQPLLTSYTATGDTLNQFLKTNTTNWTLTGSNVQLITAHMSGILYDGQAMMDKTKDDYLRKRTPWGTLGHVGLDTLDITAALARHTP